MSKVIKGKARLYPVILLLLTALFWSTGGMLIKLIQLEPLTIAGFRSLFASIVFLPFIGNPFKIKLDKLKLLCVLFYTGNVILIVLSTKYTTSANAILLQYTAPIYVTIFSNRFLGEKILKQEYFTVSGVLLGMVLFVYDGLASNNILGNIFAVMSGIFFAGIILTTRRIHAASPFEPLFLGNLLTAVLCSPFFFIENISTNDMEMLFVLGTFQLGIPYILYAFAVKHVSAIQTSIIVTLEPILNPIWVFWATGELPSILSLIGGVIVILSITSNYFILAKKNKSLTTGLQT